VLAAAELEPELLTGQKLSNTIGALLGAEEYDLSAAQVAILLVNSALMLLLDLTRNPLVVAIVVRYGHWGVQRPYIRMFTVGRLNTVQIRLLKGDESLYMGDDINVHANSLGLSLNHAQAS